jgi:hypothetical protein
LRQITRSNAGEEVFMHDDGAVQWGILLIRPESPVCALRVIRQPSPDAIDL